MRVTPRLAAGALLALLGLAAVADRGSLYLWEWRVHRFFELLRDEANLSPEQRSAEWLRGRWYGLNGSGTNPPGSARNLYPVAYTEVVLARPGAIQPSDVIVDGMGGLHLLYFPPVTAWSIRLRHLFSESNEPLWAAVYAQAYSIDIQWYGETPKSAPPSRPLVRLVHGLRGI